MTNPTVESFFANAVKSGAPSAKLKDVGDLVHGEIVDQYLVDYVPFGQKDPVIDSRTGQPEQQLVIVVQTDLRNWAGVAKVPTKIAGDANSGPKDASDDDGKRAIYVRMGHNLHSAIGTALAGAGSDPKLGIQTGAKFGAKVFNLKDTGKGNPLKEHQVMYVPPAASGEFFQGGQEQQAPAAPQQPAPQAPPAQTQSDPFGAPPAQPQGFAYGSNDQAQPPAPQQDPWAAPTQVDEPPF